MSSIGRVVSRHRDKSALSVVVLILGLMFATCAALLFAIRSKVAPEGAALVNATMIGCAIVAAGLIALGFFVRRRQWVLGEYGVQSELGGVTTTWLYRDLAETRQFYRHGSAAFLDRKSPSLISRAWTSRIGIQLRDGSHASVGYTALFDMHLLLALLEGLLSRKEAIGS
ncbi:hypothetical protein EC912_10338 [Luteibacter rhizovicinus]|uniref:Uncharacterized protein n=1 Tax=Luteibacter rhizovicinus TaxID=242606 RepID=A0A4R3YNV6_9GAMM|nr:hypothetical protein [Luteibacter rhizovicinus]TCV94555.1 hypothetical protein EC912_10338 [Luteibacter rhizovicinus]